MAKFTVSDIAAGKLIPIKFEDTDQYRKVDLEDESDENKIPVLHFQWVSREYVSIDLREEEEFMNERFPGMINEGTHVWCMRVNDDGSTLINHMWVCNFRRYGWSESSYCKETGYSNGIIYANDIDGGLKCETPEQLVRETLIRFMETSRVPRNLKEHVMVKPLWQNLLDDALSNISSYAGYAVNSSNGTIDDMIVNGVPYTYRSNK